MATDALSVSAELATRMLIAIWNSQWTSHNAAENQVCAFGCNKGSYYSDQFAHYDDCVFLHLWNDLRALREAANFGDDFEDEAPVLRISDSSPEKHG